MNSDPVVVDQALTEELLAAARSGDRGAMDDLVRATYADTYTLAYRLTGHEEDARDVTQEAYLRAWRSLGRFRGDAQFSTWMFRITANCASTARDRRARSRTDLLTDDASLPSLEDDTNPEIRASAAQDRAVLTRAVSGLPLRLRQVLVLRDIYDLSHRTIAEQLGISEAAAKVRLHRARRRLHDELTSAGTAAQQGWGKHGGVDRAS